MKWLAVIFVVLLAGSAFSDVELMVQGREHWRDGKPTTDWTVDDFKEFWRQTHKGEIISILHGGTPFGRLDVPPVIIHITVTGVTYEQAKNYVSPLLDDTSTIKQRRWHFTRSVIDSAITLWEFDGSHLIITKQQAKNLIKEYNVAAIKQKIRDRLKR